MTAHDAVGTNNATLLGAAGWTTGIVGAHALSDVLDEHGDVALPVSLTTGGASRVYASVTRNSKTGKLFIKVVNAAPAPQLVNFSLTGFGSIAAKGSSVLLTGDPSATNAPGQAQAVPETVPLHGLGTSFSETFPAYSVTVLEIPTKTSDQ